MESRRSRSTLREVQAGRTRLQGEGSGRQRGSHFGNATFGMVAAVRWQRRKRELEEVKLMFTLPPET